MDKTAPIAIVILINVVLLEAVQSSPSPPKSCHDMMPDGYDNMMPPGNRTLTFMQQGVFNIGPIRIRDQVNMLRHPIQISFKLMSLCPCHRQLF